MDIKIILDCDDVLINFMPTIVDRYNELYGTNFTVEEDVTSWNIDEEKFTHNIWSVFDKDPELISKMTLKDNKIPKILRKLKKKGCSFVVVTATKRMNELEQKKEVLTKHGVYEQVEDIIATRCKHIVSAEVIVDDNVTYLDEYRKHHPFCFTILMTARHNRDLNQDGRHVRVDNWYELEFALNEIADYFNSI